MLNDKEPITFYQFLRGYGFNDTGATELIARHNSYREDGTDRVPIERYAIYLKKFDLGEGAEYLESVGISEEYLESIGVM